MLICLSMDKWAIRVHFYSYVDLVRSLYNIGPCFHVITHVVFWVELPVQRRLCPIFVKSWVPKKKKGLNDVVSGYLTSTNLLRVDRLSTDPRDFGRRTSFVSHLLALQFRHSDFVFCRLGVQTSPSYG